MELNSTDNGSFLILSVNSARIDAAAAITFKEAVRKECATTENALILDLTEVQFIDSSGLGAIVAVKKALGKNREMILAGLTENVAKVFRLTRMDSVFALYDTVKAAVSDQTQTPKSQVAN